MHREIIGFSGNLADTKDGNVFSFSSSPAEGVLVMGRIRREAAQVRDYDIRCFSRENQITRGVRFHKREVKITELNYSLDELAQLSVEERMIELASVTPDRIFKHDVPFADAGIAFDSGFVPLVSFPLIRFGSEKSVGSCVVQFPDGAEIHSLKTFGNKKRYIVGFRYGDKTIAEDNIPIDTWAAFGKNIIKIGKNQDGSVNLDIALVDRGGSIILNIKVPETVENYPWNQIAGELNSSKPDAGKIFRFTRTTIPIGVRNPTGEEYAQIYMVSAFTRVQNPTEVFSRQ